MFEVLIEIFFFLFGVVFVVGFVDVIVGGGGLIIVLVFFLSGVNFVMVFVINKI